MMKVLAITTEPQLLPCTEGGLTPDRLTVATSVGAGLARLGETRFGLVLLDAAIAPDSALDLVERLAGAGHQVVLLARTDRVALTLDGLKRGATDVLPFPPASDELRETLGRCASMRGVAPSLPAPAALTCGAPSFRSPVTIVGESGAMVAAARTAARVADSTASVLLLGESGTGKELFARLVHARSSRRAGPFVAVNCAAIPEPLLESELFGHEKGAFTGAAGRRAGRFERAAGGTLFLDEVGDLAPAAQAKVLRALQEREVERVGGEGPVAVDVRVVAATHHDLAAEVAAGRFRADLYYRLAVVALALPPLRERGDDIRLLAEHCVARFAAEHGRPARALSREALALLLAHPWPGNVRQLANALERAVLLAEGPVVLPAHLPAEVRAPAPGGRGFVAPTSTAGGAGAASTPAPAAEGLLPLGELERRHIAHALALSGGHLARAAESLGIHRNTLRRKLQEYGVAEDALSGAHAPLPPLLGARAPADRAPFPGDALGAPVSALPAGTFEGVDFSSPRLALRAI